MKIRIKFSKSGALKFIGHLDIMRYFQKAMRRAEIEIKYSSGMSPHQIMSFALPLGLGVESIGEYLDIEVEDHVTLSSEEAIKRLNAVMVPNIKILQYRRLEDATQNAMSSVSAAAYVIRFDSLCLSENEIKQKWNEYMQQEEIFVLKKTKKSEKQIDIKPYIYELDYNCDYGQLKLCLSAGSVVNIKPQLVIQSWYAFMDLEYKERDISITRADLFLTTSEGAYVPLGEIGKDLK